MHSNTDYANVEYLGITEAADYLRVSASTLRRWEKKGFLIPERTPTGIRRYTKQQLDAVLQYPRSFDHAHFAHSQFTSNAVPPASDTSHVVPEPPAAPSYPSSSVVHPNHSPSVDEPHHNRDFFVHEEGSVDNNPSFYLGTSATESLDFEHAVYNNDLSPQSASPSSAEDVGGQSSSHFVISHDSSLPDNHSLTSSSRSEEVTLSSSYSSHSGLHPSVDSVVLPELPEIPQFNNDNAPPTPSAHKTVSFDPLPSSSSQVFHDEHAATFLDYMRKDREGHSRQASAPLETHSALSSHHSHFAAPHLDPGLSSHTLTNSHTHSQSNLKGILFFVVGFFAVIIVVFIGWALFSYLSSPPALYNPVVE